MASPLATPPAWDLVSSAYTDEIAPMFETFAHRALELAAPPPASRVVDVACGPGTLAVLAARAGHTVEALDFAPAMVARLETRLAAERVHGVTPRVGDGQALPYDDGTFAAGFSMFGLMFFPDRVRGFAELRRVLAPGARAVVSSWQALDRIPALSAIFSTLAELTGAPPAASSAAPLVTADACRAEMSAAFHDVEVVEHATVQLYDSARELWASMCRANAPLVMVQQKLGAEWPRYDEQLYAALVAAVGEGPGALTMPAWLTVGTARA